MMIDPPVDLDAISAREQHATAGPWTVEGSSFGYSMLYSVIGTIAKCWRDAEFIAHAREDIPALLALVARLQAAGDELSKEYHAAINEQEYAGTRADWIFRAQKAEAEVERLKAENTKPIRDTSKADSVYEIACEILPALRAVAREKGYALAYHGSFARDIDVIAVPWLDKAVEPLELFQVIRAEIERVTKRTAFVLNDEKAKALDYQHRNPEPKLHGRLGWSIHIAGSGTYVDLSIIPAGQAHTDAKIAEFARKLDTSYAETIKQSKRAEQAEAEVAHLRSHK